MLADVYDWGAKKTEAVKEWVSENPTTTTIAAIGTTAAALASRRLPLLAIGVGALGLTACKPEEQKEARLYESPEQCAKDGVFTEEYCKTEYEIAKKEHIEVAPQFASKEDCQEETGVECAAAPAETVKAMAAADGQPPSSNDKPADPASSGDQTVKTDSNQTTHSSHPVFIPWMYGYMMGSHSATSSTGTASTMLGSRPLYSPPTNGGGAREFVTPEGRNLGVNLGKVQVPASSLSRSTTGGAHVGEAHSGTTTGNRGSFGARPSGLGARSGFMG